MLATKKNHGAAQYWQQKSKELTNEGYTIKVRHDRIFRKKIQLQKLDKRRAHRLRTYIDYVYEIASKGEMYKRADSKDFTIHNNGGCTTIAIYKDDHKIAEAHSLVNPVDNFVRHTGLVKALEQVIEIMKEKK